MPETQQDSGEKMRCGILIIGSLWWDDGAGSQRAAWRNARLRKNEAIQVAAPLHYGRKSQSRGNTFTMTLEAGDPAGQALLVPCIKEIDSIDDLREEIGALWQAEDANANQGAFHKSWGCVGALFGTEQARETLSAPWSSIFLASNPPANPVIDKNGSLTIPWPTVDGAAVPSFDIVLATATRPASVRPMVDTIAAAWITQTGGYERYFLENVRHGIRTPYDGDIWRIIEERSPPWLQSKAYDGPINILRREAENQA